MDIDARRVRQCANADGIQKGEARLDLVSRGIPGRDIGEQEAAAAHGPAQAVCGMPASASTSHGQDIAPDVDAEVVPLPAQAPSQVPDGGQAGPAAGPAFEPVAFGQPDVFDLGVGLEDGSAARRGQHVESTASRVSRAQPREQRAGEHGIAQVVELDK